jgi:hypothetical protein
MAKMMKKAADGYTNYGSKAGKPSPVTDYAGKAGKQDSYTQYKKGGVIKKKAQDGGAIVDKLAAKTAERNTKGPEFRPGQVRRMERVFNSNPDRGIKVAKRMLKRANVKANAASEEMKKGGKMKKAQNGMVAKIKKAASDTTTKKGMNFDKKSFDSLSKLKTKAKSGGAFGMLSVKAGVDKNPNPTAADRIAGAKGMAKKGAKVATKKYKSGGTVSMQLGSYTRQIGKNYTGKNVVNKGAKAKMGKSMGKCKNGC